MSEEITYASAGVDTKAGDRAVELMKAAVKSTHGPQVWQGAGGFAGLIDVSELKNYRQPLLASSTDGVGTKLKIAQQLDIHDTIGQDLVAMVVDDIVVCGAKPIAMTDYIACGQVVPERIAQIVTGIATGCLMADTALVGGETAEHPGVMAPTDYDIAGAAVGVVEADQLLGPERVRLGDVVIALAASGLHSNGYSLVRSIVAHAGWELTHECPDLGRTLGEELLTPTRIYTKLCLDLVATTAQVSADGVRAFSHITGGGLAANVARIIPTGLAAEVQRNSALPAIYRMLQSAGNVPWVDMENTLNMGIGMVAVVAPEVADLVVATATAADVPAWVIGEIVTDSGRPECPDTVRGGKGVQAGAVFLNGAY